MWAGERRNGCYDVENNPEQSTQEETNPLGEDSFPYLVRPSPALYLTPLLDSPLCSKR
jgi:hypothetical protein